jgi:hypothetical protein
MKRTHPSPAQKFKLDPWELIRRDPGGEWLVKKLVPKIGAGILFGESQSFKSFVAMNLGAHVAIGEDWAGRRVSQATVVYIAAEGAAGVKKRKEGIEKTRPELPQRLPFYLVTGAPNLGTSPEDQIALCASIEAVGVSPGLVIVDTLSKCLGSGDENGGGMIQLLANADAITRRFSCFVLILHHIGLRDSDRERGHSSALGGTDLRILCQRKGREMSATLTWKKLKDEDCEISLKVLLSRVVTGHDEDGDELSTLVVDRIVEAEASTPAARASRISPGQRLLMSVLAEAVDEVGEMFRPFGQSGQLVKAVADTAVRSRYYARIAETPKNGDTSDKLAERQRKNFNNAIKRTIDAKVVAAADRDGERLLWLL